MEVREFRPTDIGACRALYLAQTDRVATWVAVDGDAVVGLTGLFWEGEESTIEPVVVDRHHRRAGIGRTLIETAIDESRRRGATDVNVKPVARNDSAIRAFHELGFRTLGHVQLFISFDRNGSESGSTVKLTDFKGRRMLVFFYPESTRS